MAIILILKLLVKYENKERTGQTMSFVGFSAAGFTFSVPAWLSE